MLSSEIEELEVLSREVHSSKFQQQSNFETKVRLKGVNEDAEITDPSSSEKCCLHWWMHMAEIEMQAKECA